jgi:hypothetical protein
MTRARARADSLGVYVNESERERSGGIHGNRLRDPPRRPWFRSLALLQRLLPFCTPEAGLILGRRVGGC